MAFDIKFLEELKNKNDIVDVVSSYCQLEQKGNNFWARCPLPGHTERTPSFSINRAGQFYHCFGCGKGGDVIRFVMEMEAVEYLDAIKILAQRAGMELPENTFGEKRNEDYYKKKERLLSLLNDTAHFYAANLKDKRAEKYLAYLEKRKVERSVAVQFGLGASLDFDELPRYLSQKGYTEEEMLETGVCSKNDRGMLYDALGGRLIFPIISNMGEVIAFGGRIMEDGGFAKYKNTNNNSIFTKNKTLYNINQIKKLRSEGSINELIMVEGYMDTISVFTGGFKNVVASMGTSLTKEQARLCKRYTENVLICYDGDFAGQSANIRGLGILKAEGLNVRVVSMPDGMDPDDVIKKLGAEAYKKCLDEAMPLIDFKMSILRNKFDINKTVERRKFVSEALRVVSESESVSEQEELLKGLSRETSITYESLKRDFENKDFSSVNVEKETQKQSVGSVLTAERFVVAWLLSHPKQALSNDFDAKTLLMSNPVHMEIMRYIIEREKDGKEMFPSLLYDFIPEDGKEELDEIMVLIGSAFLGESNAEKYFGDCVLTLRRDELNRELKKLKAEAEMTDDCNKRTELMTSIMKKTSELIALK